jgi:hypothetical protein
MASSVVFVESPAGGVEPGAADAFQVWARRTGRPATVHHVTLDTALETEGLVVLQVAGPPPWTGIERLLAAGRSILCSGPREAIAAIEGAARDANLNPTPVRNQPWVKGDRLSRGGDLSRPGWNPGTRQQGRTLPTLDMVIATHPSGGRLMLSRADLTHALLDRPCWGIHGYDASTAGLLVWNLMQHIHPAESRHVAYLDADAAMGMVDNRIGGSDRDRAWGVAGALDSSAGEAPRNLQSRTGRSDGGVVLVHEPPTRRRIAPS